MGLRLRGPRLLGIECLPTDRILARAVVGLA